MTPLANLHIDIDVRVHTILEGHADWLCGKGCDGCCRRLAEVPQLTFAEWELLREGLAALSAERLQEIRMLAISSQQDRPLTCPMLDRSSGTCPVYHQRPVACRTYGFYVQRDKGLYCHDIELQVDEGRLPSVVWGNHDAIDQQLARLGKSRSLSDWFECWMRESCTTELTHPE